MRTSLPWTSGLSWLLGRLLPFPLYNLSGLILRRQVLALCITATNTFSTLLVNKGTSIPAFQTLFNYILLSLIYTTYTIYKYGFKKFGKILLVDGWKYIILSFMDVEGNYFTVLAYRYTNLLSVSCRSSKPLFPNHHEPN